MRSALGVALSPVSAHRSAGHLHRVVRDCGLITARQRTVRRVEIARLANSREIAMDCAQCGREMPRTGLSKDRDGKTVVHYRTCGHTATRPLPPSN